jgi:hypothetical protein
MPALPRPALTLANLSPTQQNPDTPHQRSLSLDNQLEQFISMMEALKLRVDDLIHLCKTALERIPNDPARREMELTYLRRSEAILVGLTNLATTTSRLLYGSEETEPLED